MPKYNKKILIVENRINILKFDRIAKILIDKKIEVNWLIQNNLFLPKNGNLHIINYPTKKDLKKKVPSAIKKIKYSDRGYIFFNNNTEHYNYYYTKIKKIIDNLKPDLILGEATLFHELITIAISKKKKIRYLFLGASRFINDRLSFYKFDTLDVSGGAKKKLSKYDFLIILSNNKFTSNKNILNTLLKRRSKNILKKFLIELKCFLLE